MSGQCLQLSVVSVHSFQFSQFSVASRASATGLREHFESLNVAPQPPKKPQPPVLVLGHLTISMAWRHFEVDFYVKKSNRK